MLQINKIGWLFIVLNSEMKVIFLYFCLFFYCFLFVVFFFLILLCFLFLSYLIYFFFGLFFFCFYIFSLFLYFLSFLFIFFIFVCSFFHIFISFLLFLVFIHTTAKTIQYYNDFLFNKQMTSVAVNVICKMPQFSNKHKIIYIYYMV